MAPEEAVLLRIVERNTLFAVLAKEHVS